MKSLFKIFTSILTITSLLHLLPSVSAETGICSWYGAEVGLGAITASGEPFKMWDMTAAHKHLPFGTRVIVKNERNGRSVAVRINDRGPFVDGRILDLSRGAAQALASVHDGIVPCTVQVISMGVDRHRDHGHGTTSDDGKGCGGKGRG